MRRRPALPLVLAALAAGCGGGGEEEAPNARSVEAYERLAPRLAQQREAVAFELERAERRGRRGLAERFGRLTEEARAQAAELRGLDPPATVRGPVATLRRALEEEAVVLWRVAAAAPALGPRAATAVAPRVRAASERVRGAERGLARALGLG